MTEPLGDTLKRQLKAEKRKLKRQETENKKDCLMSIESQVEKIFPKIPDELRFAVSLGQNDCRITLAETFSSNRDEISLEDIEKLPILNKLKKFCHDNKLELQLSFDFMKGIVIGDVIYSNDRCVLFARISF